MFLFLVLLLVVLLALPVVVGALDEVDPAVARVNGPSLVRNTYTHVVYGSTQCRRRRYTRTARVSSLIRANVCVRQLIAFGRGLVHAIHATFSRVSVCRAMPKSTRVLWPTNC